MRNCKRLSLAQIVSNGYLIDLHPTTHSLFAAGVVGCPCMPLLHTAMPTSCLNIFWLSHPYIFFYSAWMCASGINWFLLSICLSVSLSVNNTFQTGHLEIQELHKRHNNSRNGSIPASMYLAEVKAVTFAVIRSDYRSQALYTHSDQRYIGDRAIQ